MNKSRNVAKQHNVLVNEIAKEENMDKRVVDRICRSALTFTANVFRNPIDYRPIRWRYLGVFSVLKNKVKRANETVV